MTGNEALLGVSTVFLLFHSIWLWNKYLTKVSELRGELDLRNTTLLKLQSQRDESRKAENRLREERDTLHRRITALKGPKGTTPKQKKSGHAKGSTSEPIAKVDLTDIL